MGQRKVIESYYDDVCNLTDLLGKLINSYRLLVGSAEELNKITLAKKGNVKDALKRAEKVGNIIDDIIKRLEDASITYGEYCDFKSCILKEQINMDNILKEINEELSFKEP